MSTTKSQTGSSTAHGPAPTQVMIFRSSEHFFGVPLGDVEEILTPMPLTAIPHSEQFVLGMGSRGRYVFPVVDFYGLTSRSEPRPQKDSAVYFLCRPPSGWTAVAVDALVKIQPMILDATTDKSGGFSGVFATSSILKTDFSQAVLAVGAIDSSPLPVLNLPALLELAIWAKKRVA